MSCFLSLFPCVCACTAAIVQERNAKAASSLLLLSLPPPPVPIPAPMAVPISAEEKDLQEAEAEYQALLAGIAGNTCLPVCLSAMPSLSSPVLGFKSCASSTVPSLVMIDTSILLLFFILFFTCLV